MAETDEDRPDDREQLPDNRGRWGDDDERGTLNLVTDAVRARAAAEVRTGRHVPLARPIDPAPVASNPFAPPAPSSPPVQQALLWTGVPPMGMSEVLTVVPHDPRLTHLDAVVHMPLDGEVNPRRPLAEAVTAAGVQHGSTTAFADGVVTRGVLLDLAPGERLPPAHPVTAADLDAAEERAGVRLEPGDALVVRTGWEVSWDADEPTPGMTLDAVAWMHRRDVAVYAGDVGDAVPPLEGPVPMPLHMVGLARLGMPLVDSAAVEDLAAVCAELGRSAFLLVLAPPRLRGATGVPVNPVAVF
ncbi:cyclase family protein [Pseudokineococcus sp. 5B2Z-1]|uniref:cyclase family protein n=1 Tax=Pseudokineococcus sp. 5B2Z-1 TaxID=3132744 RepID=UPI0030ADA63E